VFDNICGRIFFEKPTRKHTAPFFSIGCARRAFIHQQLNKGTFIRVIFPRRCFFAGAQSYDNFAKANGFARFEFNVARLSVALVQKAQNGNTFCHGCAKCIIRTRNNPVCGRLGFAGFLRCELFFVSGSARRERCQQRQQHQAVPANHDASGLHAS
jgi:hypothetical protein